MYPVNNKAICLEHAVSAIYCTHHFPMQPIALPTPQPPSAIHKHATTSTTVDPVAVTAAAPFGFSVVGTGTAAWPPVQPSACRTNTSCPLTSAYTPGKFGRAQPYPNDTTPARLPPQIRPPPESPWQESRPPSIVPAQIMPGRTAPSYEPRRLHVARGSTATDMRCSWADAVPFSAVAPQPATWHMVPGGCVALAITTAWNVWVARKAGSTRMTATSFSMVLRLKWVCTKMCETRRSWRVALPADRMEMASPMTWSWVGQEAFVRN